MDSFCDLASPTRAGTKATTLTTKGSIQNLPPMKRLATPAERVEAVTSPCLPTTLATNSPWTRTNCVGLVPRYLATLYMRRTEGHPATYSFESTVDPILLSRREIRRSARHQIPVVHEVMRDILSYQGRPPIRFYWVSAADAILAASAHESLIGKSPQYRSLSSSGPRDQRPKTWGQRG